MDKIQEFASTWSVVGGRLDDGTALDRAEACKEEIRGLLSGRLAARVEPWHQELAALLQAIRPKYGVVGSRDVDVAAQQRHIDRAIELLAAPVATTTMPARLLYDESGIEREGQDPLERLRFFCSLAMSGQDRLDVESLFDAARSARAVPSDEDIDAIWKEGALRHDLEPSIRGVFRWAARSLLQRYGQSAANLVRFHQISQPAVSLQLTNDRPLAFESALSELIDKIIPGLDAGDILADARQASAALVQQPSAQSVAAVTFVHELAMGAYKPEEIEVRAKEIARMAPLEVQPSVLELSRCANCGLDADAAKEHRTKYAADGEWFCSLLCEQQYAELGCPHESHDGYRHPVETACLLAQSSAQDLGDAAVLTSEFSKGYELGLRQRTSKDHEDAELGRIAMRFVDRAGDYCKEDPAEKICDEFNAAMAEAVGRVHAAQQRT